MGASPPPLPVIDVFQLHFAIPLSPPASGQHVSALLMLFCCASRWLHQSELWHWPTRRPPRPGYAASGAQTSSLVAGANREELRVHLFLIGERGRDIAVPLNYPSMSRPNRQCSLHGASVSGHHHSNVL
jgi:hypothetical protein